MAERLNTALRNALADLFGGAFDSGTLKIYSGAQPASANDAPSGTLIATINLPADAFAAAATGAVAKNGTWSATVSTSGTAGWFRITSSDGTKVFDGAVALTGSVGGEELLLDTLSLLQGGVVTVSTFTYTQPAG